MPSHPPIAVTLIVDIETSRNSAAIQQLACKQAGFKSNDRCYVQIKKRAIDARSRQIKVQLQLDLYEDKATYKPVPFELPDRDVSLSKPVYIIGAGPAGLFAALRCIELGCKPIVFEQGKSVQDRRRDLVQITRHGIVNPLSNYSFGEGGAGTYSDGKLYTRSKKKGSIEHVINTFIHFGAAPDIAIDNHPHIGTNKLPHIISAMSSYIRQVGGEVHFNSQLTDISTLHRSINSIIINYHTKIKTDAVLLATGHSARGVFKMLHHAGIAIEPKSFALGVRIEHPQALIDLMQYRQTQRHTLLPPASYQLVTQADDRGVYSFCMCPGGIIAPCATAPDEVVTNGWSPSKRNNPFANSGLVTEVHLDDAKQFARSGPLALLDYQQAIEQQAFDVGGRTLHAPAQRLSDFLNNTTSSTLPDCSYQPGITSCNLADVLPLPILHRLRLGLHHFCKQKPDYYHPDAVLVAPESRTSSPVRIPRDPITFMHPTTLGLYPCAEGAGYAGGIMSAAIDGTHAATQLINKYLAK